jgi:hypothetical protein
MSFYITLPSNASLNLYPDNQPGKFFVKLPQTIDVSSQYEVGLAEIQFSNSYFNVLEGEVWLRYYPPAKAPVTILKLTPGLYRSAESVVDEFNKVIVRQEVSGQQAKIRFYYNKGSKKAQLKLFSEGEVRISETLKDILGFTDSRVSENTPVLEGTEGHLDNAINNVYVYSDIVAARPVGDVMVPLLRAIPILDRHSNSMFRIYDKPHYLPLSRFSFDLVEILLTTETGKTIAFESGTSVLTLHFRPRRHFDL